MLLGFCEGNNQSEHHCVGFVRRRSQQKTVSTVDPFFCVCVCVREGGQLNKSLAIACCIS